MSQLTDVLKSIQQKPHEQWNGNLDHRKTIRSHRAEIEFLKAKLADSLDRVEGLESKLDFAILHKSKAEVELLERERELFEVNRKLEDKSILLRAALAELQRMDKQLGEVRG